ncbi:MAG TPA: TadE/TadG family type IV pilus assembly protein [Myxococcales bacterium]|nr:TadE/TadG family type IV pilus assembly protein [Myxococcales bacterium]
MRNGRGQVAVEAALAGPLVVLLGLGILQLGLVQQARVLVEYAAFAAARAGVVWGADGARMHDAALLVLLPVMARADSWEAVAASWPEVRRKDLAMHALLKDARAPGLPPLMEAAGLAGLVRVDVVGPRASDGEGEEIDFDLPDAFGEGPGLRAASDRFTRPLGEEPDQDALRAATRLTVRVRYLHELQIPLAGWAVFTCWMATHPGLEGELEVLERLAREERRYFLPLGATYALRMQSSVQRKWLAR